MRILSLSCSGLRGGSRRAAFAGTMVLAFIGALASANPVLADGLFFALPEDATGIRYSMEVNGKSAGGDEVKGSGEVSVASVGKLTVGDEKCRWIELKMELKVNEQNQLWLGKFLIPEEHLVKGKNPGKEAKRGWVKVQDGEPMAVNQIPGISDGPFGLFFVGPGSDQQQLEKVEVQNAKLGKLPCAGYSSTHEVEQGTASISAAFEHRLHEKAPFGIVESKLTFELKNGGQTAISGTALFKLIDINTTALSELADKN
jgi:hypothetical protein